MLDTNKEPIHISDSDADRLLKHVPSEYRLPVTLLRMYGWRVSELLSLTPENFEGDVIHLQRLKKGKKTHQRIGPQVREELLTLVASTAPGCRIFPFCRKTIWQAIRSAGLRAGVNERFLHCHAFRHAAGRRAARVSNGNIHAIADFLGHKTPQMAWHYSQLELSPDEALKFL